MARPVRAAGGAQHLDEEKARSPDRHWSALWVAFARIALGAITLLVLVRVRRERLPREFRLWAHCAVAAFLFNSVPWTLFAYGEQHTSSIVAGLWNATTPLWVLVLTFAGLSDEPATPARTTGLALGFAGVALLLGPWRGLGGGQLIGHLACAGAALCTGSDFTTRAAICHGALRAGWSSRPAS